MQISMRFLAAAAAAATLLLAAACADESTIQDELSKNGFPPGLFPASVVSYSIDSDGNFKVKLASYAYINIPVFIFYQKEIRGRISFCTITDLEGIQFRHGSYLVPVFGIVAISHGKTLYFRTRFAWEQVSWDQSVRGGGLPSDI